MGERSDRQSASYWIDKWVWREDEWKKDLNNDDWKWHRWDGYESGSCKVKACTYTSNWTSVTGRSPEDFRCKQVYNIAFSEQNGLLTSRSIWIKLEKQYIAFKCRTANYDSESIIKTEVNTRNGKRLSKRVAKGEGKEFRWGKSAFWLGV